MITTQAFHWNKWNFQVTPSSWAQIRSFLYVSAHLSFLAHLLLAAGSFQLKVGLRQTQHHNEPNPAQDSVTEWLCSGMSNRCAQSPGSMGFSANGTETALGLGPLSLPLQHSQVVFPVTSICSTQQWSEELAMYNNKYTLYWIGHFSFFKVFLKPFNVYLRVCMCRGHYLTRKATSSKWRKSNRETRSLLFPLLPPPTTWRKPPLIILYQSFYGHRLFFKTEIVSHFTSFSATCYW